MVQFFNETNIGSEGFPEGRDGFSQALGAWLQCRQTFKQHHPGIGVLSIPPTPGHNDSWFTGDSFGQHWFHGPEGCVENPTPSEITAAADSCVMRPMFEACDAISFHVYANVAVGVNGNQATWYSKRHKRHQKYLTRYGQPQIILEADMGYDEGNSDQERQQNRANLSDWWYRNVILPDPKIMGVCHWWMTGPNEADPTWSKHFTYGSSGMYPIIHKMGALPATVPPPPPPPPEEPDMSLEQWLVEQGNNAAVVPVSPGQAVFDAIIGDGNIPNGPEVYATYPTSGQKYALRSGEHPTVASGAKWTYYVPVPAPGQPWPGVQRVLRSGTPVQPLPIAPSLIPYPSPNSGPRPGDFDAIVLHATAGPLGPSLAWLTNPASEASTHYLIAKDGRIFQMVPDHLRAWHAGASAHAGRADWNDFSLGVEIVNQNNGADPYPAAQVASLISLLRWLVWKYDIAPDDLVTHAQVAVPPGRKSDPKGLALGYIKSEVYP